MPFSFLQKFFNQITLSILLETPYLDVTGYVPGELETNKGNSVTNTGTLGTLNLPKFSHDQANQSS